MGRRPVCIPGLICIENVTLFVVVIFLIGFLAYFFLFVHNYEGNESDGGMAPRERYGDKIVVNVPPQRNALDYRDVMLNPYAAPYYDTNYASPTASPFMYGGSNFRQVGILTPREGDSEGRILPLLGRPLTNRSNQWNYYTVADQHNNVKIPVRVGGGRDCRGRRRGGKGGLDEYGVGELNAGDQVFLEGLGKDYKVTMYNSNSPDFLGG